MKSMVRMQFLLRMSRRYGDHNSMKGVGCTTSVLQTIDVTSRGVKTLFYIDHRITCQQPLIEHAHR